MDLDTLGDQHPWIEATNLLDPKESIVIDVTNEESDFIDVRRNRDSRSTRTLPIPDQVAKRIDRQAIDDRFQECRHDIAHLVLAGSDPGSLGERAKHVQVD